MAVKSKGRVRVFNDVKKESIVRKDRKNRKEINKSSIGGALDHEKRSHSRTMLRGLYAIEKRNGDPSKGIRRRERKKRKIKRKEREKKIIKREKERTKFIETQSEK